MTCSYPDCRREAIAWYRWTELGGREFATVCAEHAQLIRDNVHALDGRGRIYNGIAEGAGQS